MGLMAPLVKGDKELMGEGRGNAVPPPSPKTPLPTPYLEELWEGVRACGP